MIHVKHFLGWSRTVFHVKQFEASVATGFFDQDTEMPYGSAQS